MLFRVSPQMAVAAIAALIIGGLITAVAVHRAHPIGRGPAAGNHLTPSSTTRPATVPATQLPAPAIARSVGEAHAPDRSNVAHVQATPGMTPRTQEPPATAPSIDPPVATGGSDFAPPASERVASTVSSDANPPSAVVAPTGSDFGDVPAPEPEHRDPAARAIALAQSRGITDEQIGHAIDHGVDYLLAQFKDGEISPDKVLSDSQRQALDALCVYALLQASQSTSDPRLSLHGKLVPAMLEKLRAYDLNSDGETTNRPITYGRSLRAAALATSNRPEDREILKQDVAWLIASQIGGAYSYDDLYRQLMARGMQPMEEKSNGPVRAPAPPAPQAKEEAKDTGDFSGGSAPPTVDGPYVEGSPPYVPPSYGTPRFSGGSGAGGINKLRPYVQIWNNKRDTWPQPEPIKRVPLIPLPRLYMPQPKYVPPPKSKFNPLPKTPGRQIPYELNDVEVKLPPQVFDYPWDNSNSQYGLLGVWSGAEVGMEVPEQYWKEVERHWVSCQLPTGEWTYHKQERAGYFAMTCAGVASLLVTHDYLDIPKARGSVGRPPYSKNLAAGIGWLDQADHGTQIPGPGTHYLGYDLFGLERVGLASGYKYFGAHDWYRELAGRIVPTQHPNGAWGREDHGNDTLIETAYTLLFLSRGRHPVMMTKLKFEGAWDNRPRDLANLSRFAGRELERPLNWQVVGIDHDWSDWFDSPVLYIASHQPPHCKDDDYRRLRSFVLAGGLIFTQADGGSAAFNQWVPELARRIAPGYPLKPLPDNSPIYSIQYKIASHPAMLGVSNGARLLLVHSPADLAIQWQERSTKTHRSAFELGSNIFIYASGKPELRNRLDSPFIPPAPDAPEKTVRVAQLQYEGNWNPEPAAWFRFSRYLQWETGQSLELRPLPIDQLVPGACSIATLTGTDAMTFSAAQMASLHAYVESGGVLLIDACGGENGFTQCMRDGLLRTTFADAQDEPLLPGHPLFKDLKAAAGHESPMRLRGFASERLGRLAPHIRVLHLGKGCVVFSAVDFTSALLGTHTWGIVGYEPVSTQTFIKNLVLWTESLR